MFLHHLRLLIQKSLRYAWRCRTCCGCPKIIFELFIPLIFLLFLILVRWIHAPDPPKDEGRIPAYAGSKPTGIQLSPFSIADDKESIYVFNYTSTSRCPSPNIVIEIVDSKLFNRFTRLCPQAQFILSSAKPKGSLSQILLNTSSTKHEILYRCRYDHPQWCQNLTQLNKDPDPFQIQHPSAVLCQRLDAQESKQLIRTYLAIESLLDPPVNKQHLTVYTWPCLAYARDPLFEVAPVFVLIVLLFLIDGCILFAYNLLFLALIEEKSQGITELLRLISIRPILNSLAWFLRVFFIQTIINILLIVVLKISFNGGVYLLYVPLWLIIPSVFIWTVQVLSRAILAAHFFHSSLKAKLWSWLMYLIIFWLACTSTIRLPMILHLLISVWFPFYSSKRLFILLFRMNTSLGRSDGLINEVLAIWISMLLGSVIMWLLAYYFDQIFPGKYGIPRPWSWPLDALRTNRVRHQKRRDSVAMQMVETLPDVNTTVRVNNLTKTYGRFHTEKQLAVDHISFKLEKSMIHGLIGHNGAGKTSTIEMMCGLLSCDCGTIEIHDQDLYENLTELRKCIGYCPQQDMLFSHLTVAEQLEFYARVRSSTNAIDRDQINELLRMMDMNNCSQQLCHTLSGGMQRKVSILCAFVGQANVILLGKGRWLERWDLIGCFSR